MLIHEYFSNINTSGSKSGNTIPNVSVLSPGDDIAMERGGILRIDDCDVHMDSLANVWNPSTVTQNFIDSDPSVSFSEEENCSPVHLIILQHGFQGTGFDMRLIRNALHMEFSQYLVTFSSTILLLICLL